MRRNRIRSTRGIRYDREILCRGNNSTGWNCWPMKRKSIELFSIRSSMQSYTFHSLSLSLSFPVSRALAPPFPSFRSLPSLFTVPPAPITKSDRAQVASTYFCKNLGIPVLEGAREFEEKRERNAHRRYFKRRLPPISRDLIQDPRIWATSFRSSNQRFNGIPFYFAFFPLSFPPPLRQVWRTKERCTGAIPDKQSLLWELNSNRESNVIIGVITILYLSSEKKKAYENKRVNINKRFDTIDKISRDV